MASTALVKSEIVVLSLFRRRGMAWRRLSSPGDGRLACLCALLMVTRHRRTCCIIDCRLNRYVVIDSTFRVASAEPFYLPLTATEIFGIARLWWRHKKAASRRACVGNGTSDPALDVALYGDRRGPQQRMPASP